MKARAAWTRKAMGKPLPKPSKRVLGRLIDSQGHSKPEAEFQMQLRSMGIPHVREYRFAPHRGWRFDFAFPEWVTLTNRTIHVAVEIEGWGRHQRFIGFEQDCEKYAEAAIRGWMVIRCTPRQVTSGQALRWLERALA